MNPAKDKGGRDKENWSLAYFWPCLIVFVCLAVDYGFRLSEQLEQRTQLTNARLMQAQNQGALAQVQQLNTRLEALSLDLIALAQTNAAARQIVQEFNIRWNPGPGATSNPPAQSNPTPTTPK